MDPIKLRYTVSSEDFTRAGEASSAVKRSLKQLGLNPEIIRRVAIAMYEGEINMVIHANGGVIHVIITDNEILMVLNDSGKGIADISKAMQEGFSTANDNARNLGFGAGMGLPNMKRCTDEIHVESVVGQGTTVTMKVYLDK